MVLKITSVEKVYPFKVINSEANHDEYDRKVAKLAWVKELGEALGLKVVQRQEGQVRLCGDRRPRRPRDGHGPEPPGFPTGSIKAGRQPGPLGEL